MSYKAVPEGQIKLKFDRRIECQTVDGARLPILHMVAVPGHGWLIMGNKGAPLLLADSELARYPFPDVDKDGEVDKPLASLVAEAEKVISRTLELSKSDHAEVLAQDSGEPDVEVSPPELKDVDALGPKVEDPPVNMVEKPKPTFKKKKRRSKKKRGR